MGTLLDVLRALLDGALKVGALTEIQHREAHAVVDENDPQVAAARAQAAQFSPADQQALDELLAKQQQAAEAAQRGAAEGPTASPLLPGAPQ